MKKLFFALFAVVLFLSCEQPESVIAPVEEIENPVVVETPYVPDPIPITPEEPTTPVEPVTPEEPELPVRETRKFYVKNSNWETVDKGDLLSERSARSTGNDIPASITSFVKAYNEDHIDDQLTILTEDVPVMEAPNCNVYIVKKNSHEIVLEFLDFSRVLLAERRDDFAIDARQYGDAEVYVDKIPPAYVPPVDSRPDHIKYAIYLVNADGSIFYQENAIDAKPLDWKKTNEEWFVERVSQFELDIRLGNFPGCHLVSGEEYAEP